MIPLSLGDLIPASDLHTFTPHHSPLTPSLTHRRVRVRAHEKEHIATPHGAASDEPHNPRNARVHPAPHPQVILTNQALVPVSFEIRPHPHDHDTVFHWQSTKGRIPADGSVAINIKYCPLSTGSFDLDYFDVVTPGGNVQVTRPSILSCLCVYPLPSRRPPSLPPRRLRA